MREDYINIVHGDGGKYTNNLIKEVFYKSYKNETLIQGEDAALINIENNKILNFTTDGFIIKPIFFKGGDIGKLSICGTINDLVVSGSVPKYISASFIIEEGFEIKNLIKIANSMKEVCDASNVQIVTGDTKVVEKGKIDGVFITTSGIGINYDFKEKSVIDKDAILIINTIGEHGTTVALDRFNIINEGNIKSDCASLTSLIPIIKKYKDNIKIMKDPTRGGVGQTLNEISNKHNIGMHLFEKYIPIKKWVLSINEMLGFDPLYLANEGNMIIICESSIAKHLRNDIKNQCGFNYCSIVGYATNKEKFVFIENDFGGKRILSELEEHLIPRIC